MATEGAWFACTPELLLKITKLSWLFQLWKKGVFANKAALATVLGGGFVKQRVALQNLVAKDPAPWRRWLCHQEAALPTSRGGFAKEAAEPSWSFTFV